MPPRRSTGPDAVAGVQAVQLVLEILEHLAKQELAGVTEIANALGTTKARVHRHLRTLVNTGYAVQEAGGERYGAGPRLIVLAQMLAQENSLTSVARPVMQKLRDALGHTITLAKVTGDVSYDATSADLGSVIVQGQKSAPDVWIDTGYVPDISLLLRTAKQQNFR